MLFLSHRIWLRLVLVSFLFMSTASLAIDDTVFFPGKETFQGTIGSVGETDDGGESQMALYYIPKLTNLLLWIVAPFLAVMFIYSGLKFIYAGDDDEALGEAKKFFLYGIMGIIFIFISYSLMKVVYKIIADDSSAVETASSEQ